jgi:hypothetical protein
MKNGGEVRWPGGAKNDGGPGTKKTTMRTYTDRLEVTKITKARMMQARLKKGSSTPWEEEESWRLLMESLVLVGEVDSL